jgi:hypothetical protein
MEDADLERMNRAYDMGKVGDIEGLQSILICHNNEGSVYYRKGVQKGNLRLKAAYARGLARAEKAQD